MRPFPHLNLWSVTLPSIRLQTIWGVAEKVKEVSSSVVSIKVQVIILDEKS